MEKHFMECFSEEFRKLKQKRQQEQNHLHRLRLRRFSTSGVVSVVSKQLSHRDAKSGEGDGSLWWDASINGCHFVTWKWLKLTDTLPETNITRITPENGSSQKETHFPTIHFQGLC